MASLNLCQFMGNVGSIETRYMPNGDPVTNLSLGVNKTWKDKNNEKQERTEWVRVTIYGGLAKIAGDYVKKGDPLYVSGEMMTRKWTDKSNIERYTTEIVADRMQMLGGKQGSSTQQQNNAPKSNSDSGFDDLQDDIPF